MNPRGSSFEQMLAYRLEPEIYSHQILAQLAEFLGPRECKIHLKIDTGMHRLGFELSMLDALIAVLKDNRNVHVASIFSHLAGADEAEHDGFSRSQVQRFLVAAEKISSALGYRPLFHVLNSPGILRLPEYQFDMVRLGIGLYGVNPTNKETDFRPVATLKTMISQIKHVPAGETIGYGRRGVAATDLTTATIAIGYADGFNRAFSRGRGKVLVNGALAPVIGNVCMDMTMIDITGIPAAEGDEVVIFGKGLPIQDVASWIGTIPYEILTSTSERVKRVFTAESL
jgi:Alr-MurF fusion protein